MTPPSALETWRCPQCSRILAKLTLAPGSLVEVKCACNRVSIREQAVPPRVQTHHGAPKAVLTR